MARASDAQPAVNQKAKPPDRTALIYRRRLFRRYERRIEAIGGSRLWTRSDLSWDPDCDMHRL